MSSVYTQTIKLVATHTVFSRHTCIQFRFIYLIFVLKHCPDFIPTNVYFYNVLILVSMMKDLLFSRD